VPPTELDPQVDYESDLIRITIEHSAERPDGDLGCAEKVQPLRLRLDEKLGGRELRDGSAGGRGRLIRPH
jgi:hypothetical protein